MAAGDMCKVFCMCESLEGKGFCGVGSFMKTTNFFNMKSEIFILPRVNNEEENIKLPCRLSNMIA